MTVSMILVCGVSHVLFSAFASAKQASVYMQLHRICGVVCVCDRATIQCLLVCTMSVSLHVAPGVGLSLQRWGVPAVGVPEATTSELSLR